jgi:hypothetical protein
MKNSCKEQITASRLRPSGGSQDFFQRLIHKSKLKRWDTTSMCVCGKGGLRSCMCRERCVGRGWRGILTNERTISNDTQKQ